MTATALRYLGDQADAKRYLDSVAGQYVPPIQGSHIARFQLGQRAAAVGTLSNVLWLRGFLDQVVSTTQSALEAAQTNGHALSLCNALVHAAVQSRCGLATCCSRSAPWRY
jgi:hypothetical protein